MEKHLTFLLIILCCKLAQAGGPSMYTSPQSLTTDCPVPSSLSATDAPYVLNTVNFGWESSALVAYELQYQPQGSLPTNWTTVSGINTNRYSLTLPNNAYNWRVRAICTAGVASAYSSPQSFTMECNPPGFGALFPNYNTTGYSITTAPVYRADVGLIYTAQWRPAGTETWNTIAHNSSLYFTLTGLTNNTVYELRSQRECSPIHQSGFSEITSYTTTCPGINAGYFSQCYTNRICWNFSGSPGTTDFQVQWRKLGTIDWQTSPVINTFSSSEGPSYTIPNPTTGTHEVRIRTLCADGSASDFTPIRQFDFYACSGEVPNNSFWDGTISCLGATEATFLVSGCADERVQYELRWRKMGTDCWQPISPIDSLYDGLYEPLKQAFIASRFVKIRNLSPQTVYEFQTVSRETGLQETIFYGAIKSFTTTSGIPDNLELKCVSQDAATVAWGAWRYDFFSQDIICYPNQNQYIIQYRPVGSSTWTTTPTLNAVSEYSLTELKSNTAHEWRIRRVYSDGTAGVYSAPASFTTTACQRPVVYNSYYFTPRNCSAPLIAWASCAGTQARYEIRYRPTGVIEWVTRIIVPKQDIRGLAYYEFGGLPDRISYEVQLRTSCPDGNQSDYSESVIIMAGCSQPYECPPIEGVCHYNITAQTATLSWKGSGPYELRWRKGYTATWNVIQIPYTRPYPLTYRLTNLEPNTPYDWQVRSLCAGESGFSAVDFFRTVCNPPDYGRAKAIKPNSVVLTWSRNDSSQIFTLYWRKTGETSWQRIGGLLNTSYSLTGLSRSTAYEWRVESECGSAIIPIEAPIRAFRTTATLSVFANTLVTQKSGLWTDPSVWNCGRIPTSLDAVQINHPLTIPAQTKVNTRKISYGPTGKLFSDTGSHLQIDW